ncbi:helix-turn-helix domain-containing protein [Streptomyces massasporeus]|uniref:helix-turn-helix domain-containing protein n=1 Tax=Streptomyces massasporeus TaxID=67324 RepID=UPI00371907CC
MSACPETERFAALLRSLKSRSGLSYEALARKSGLAGSTLHRYCRGTSVPQDYGSVHRLATVCGATPDELRTLHRLWALADAARDAAAAAAAGAGTGSAAGAGTAAGAEEVKDDRAESEAEGRAGATATATAPGRPAGPGTDSALGRPAGPATDPALGRAAFPATDAARGRDAETATDSASGRTAVPATHSASGRNAETATDSASGRASAPATDAALGRDTAPATDAAPSRASAPTTDAVPSGAFAPTTDAAPSRASAPTTDAAPGRDAGRPGVEPSPRPAGSSRRRRLRTSVVTAAVVAAVSVSAWALTNGRSPSGGGGRGSGEDRPLFSANCSPVIAMGQHDECVREVQRLLHAKGADIGVDGDFGPQTLRRVTAFQVLAGLQPNGVVGEPTKRALYTSRVRMAVWSPQKVRQRVRDVFPEVPDKAVAIADCQSFLDPLHILPNTNGTRNWGLFQISDARLRELGGTPREALDPEWNIRAAHTLWSRDRDFGDWPHCERAADAPRSPATAPSGT